MERCPSAEEVDGIDRCGELGEKCLIEEGEPCPYRNMCVVCGERFFWEEYDADVCPSCTKLVAEADDEGF